MSRVSAFFLSVFLSASLQAASPQIPILAYHEVDPTPERGWGVSTENFTDQMQYISATGYKVIPIVDLADYLSGKRDSLPSDPVVITADDGWLCAFTQIQPILMKFGFPWSLYVYPAIIGHGLHALNWAQVKELANDGVDVEDHTLTHPHLMRRSHPEMTDEQYAAWLHQELADSKSQIETQTGRPVRFLSYPYGDFDRAVESEAALDGYIIALRSREGWNNRRSNPLELKRFLIESDTTLDRFRADLGALDLLVKDLSPASEGIIPPAQKIISATVPEVGQFDPDSIHIALLGDDRATPSWDPAARQISLTLNGTLAPGRHHVVVWARRLRDGKRAVALWTFYTSGPEKKRYDAMRVQLLELPLHHAQAQPGAAP